MWLLRLKEDKGKLSRWGTLISQWAISVLPRSKAKGTPTHQADAERLEKVSDVRPGAKALGSVGNNQMLQHKPLTSPVQAGEATAIRQKGSDGEPVAPGASFQGRSDEGRAMVWTPGKDLEGPDWLSRYNDVNDGGTVAPEREDLVLLVEASHTDGESMPEAGCESLEADQKHYTVIVQNGKNAEDTTDPIMMATTTPIEAKDMPGLWDKFVEAQAEDDYCKLVKADPNSHTGPDAPFFL